MSRFQLRLPAFLFAFLILTGCEVSSSEGEDNVVGGVNLTEVFAPPTDAEMQTVIAEWETRNPVAAGVGVLAEESVLLNGQTPATVRIVQHDVDGVTHYGAVITPEGLQTGSAPVLVYAHGGDGGVSIDGEALLLLSLFPDLATEFVTVVPSFRDEPLSFRDQVWQSEGPASPWDLDVDDTFALIDVASQIEPATDASRIAVLGMSRGGAVGMLMSARSDAVERVLAFFGPTDFYGPFVQEVVTEILEGNPRQLPGLDYLAEEFLLPYQAGEVTLEEIRIELVRRSAIYFIDRIGTLQIHHGTADTVVPVSQADRLIAAMSSAGRSAPEFESFIYPGGEHNPFTLEGALITGSDFIEAMISNSPTKGLIASDQ